LSVSVAIVTSLISSWMIFRLVPVA
jgi:hypothetical protein